MSARCNSYGGNRVNKGETPEIARAGGPMSPLRQRRTAALFRRVAIAATLGTVTGLAFAACASTAPSAAANAGRATRSYVVYPPIRTSAISNTSSCRLAHNTAVPAAKRSHFAEECNRLLSHATDPVTKPALLPPISTSPTAPMPHRPSGPTSTPPTAPACPPASLGIRPGPPLSPQTGEEGVIIAVSSASSTPCTVTGYAKITFIRGAQPIPFTYLDGKGQYVTHQQPFP